ncbi:sugar transporter [Glomus cerebriforme]|uniref:Sugar transporter n=1 Tax=Glomus cerebriforme TaxID=658196 RepID=A0A397T9P3_9GLOM|nr:sugar transporter [Glomus cerebriforme]
MSHFRREFPSGPAKEGSIVSSLLAGCFVGALISGYFADKIGRKFSILAASIVFIVGGVLQASTTTFIQLYFGRIVSGLSIGILSMIVPLYQSEISPKEIRGRLISFQQWSITIGIVVSFWVDYATEKIGSSAQWRISLWIQNVPALILAFGMLFLPFSPRWLVYSDRDEEAITVLAKLRAGGNKTSMVVRKEYTEIKDNVRFEREFASKNYSELIKKGPENIRKRMLLGIFIQIFQQSTGINAVMYYAPQIFNNAGIGASSGLLVTGINGGVNILAIIPAILWIDRCGRRPTLISGSILMGASMLVIGSILAIDGTKYFDSSLGKNFIQLDNKASSFAVIIFIYIFVAGFAYSWGPTGWIYPAEIYPLRIRSKAMSITTASNWLFNFVLGQVVPILLDSITWGTYIIFGILSIIIAIFVHIFYPETKCHSLEEMDSIFGNVPNNISTSRQPHSPSSLSSESINLDQQRENLRDLESGLPEEEEIYLSTSLAETHAEPSTIRQLERKHES